MLLPKQTFMDKVIEKVPYWINLGMAYLCYGMIAFCVVMVILTWIVTSSPWW